MNRAVDEDEEEEVIRRICCSVSTFFCSNCCWVIMSLILIATGLSGVLLPATNLDLFPPESFIIALVFGGFTIIVVGMGFLGTCARVELCFILYIFFASLGLLGQIVSFALLVLYSVDVSGLQDNNEGIISGEVRLTDHLITLSENNEEWIDFQDKLECCGVDLVTGFNGDLQVQTETGAKCEDGAAALAILRAANNIDVADNLQESEPEFGNSGDFFCSAVISQTFTDLVPFVGVVSGLYILIQLVALVAAGRMYWVPEFLGGWALDEEAMTEIAKTKGIQFNVPDHNPNQNGGRVLSTLRNAGNRMSYRLKNAVTADPNVPASAGFLKRLSTNRAVSFVGAAPGQGQAQEGQADASGGRGVSMRSMLSRISIRSKGSAAPKSFIDAGQMNSTRTTNTAAPPGMGMSGRSVTNSKLLEVNGPSPTRSTANSLNI